MTMTSFIRKNRARWERLEALLTQYESKAPTQFGRETIRELSSLYRGCTSDLAYAQTYYPNTTLLQFLHQLAGRAHHQIYRSEPFSLTAFTRFFRYDVPEAARANLNYLALAVIIFLTAFALGLTAVSTDPGVAALVVPQPILEDIYAGKLWTQSLFSAMPASVSSALIFTNNISIAFLCFAGGLTCGGYTVLLLLLNGFILGVIFKLCADHNLLWPLFQFVTGHGFVELSVILVAGAAGLVLASALLSPGTYSRLDALNLRGKSAVRLALGCVPPLVAMGIVEGFISPAPSIPAWAKITLGLVLLATYWFYLLISGQRTVDVSRQAR
ncbi:MAG: hypothetical protein B9S32_12160 [Verrucomicrobia bacterium Tous-C9LFEB]|nr:MAG: hypothetical protein B9S32_12160 [Verrucomicrobia bacterium Tous-C9LFEB]